MTKQKLNLRVRLAVCKRSHAGVFSEGAAEIGRSQKVQRIRNLVHVHIGGPEDVHGLRDHEVLDPLEGLLPRRLADDVREIFRGDAELVGIELEVAVAFAILLDQTEELLRDGVCARGTLLFFMAGFQFVAKDSKNKRLCEQRPAAEHKIYCVCPK